jgi:alkane 1-monooxygenase
MKKFLINIRYFLTPLLIFLTAISIIIGGTYCWLGLSLLVSSILIDWVSSKLSFCNAQAAGTDENGENYGIESLLKTMMWFQYPVFVVIQLALAYRVYSYINHIDFEVISLYGLPIQMGTTGAELVGAAISSGIFLGLGIMFGHELAHTKGPTFILSRWMMALTGIAHFCYAHVYNHHLELGCEDDPATAPRGRTIYSHWLLSHFGQSRFLYVMEQHRLQRLGKPFLSFSNRWLRGYAMSLPTIFLFWFIGGWVGLLIMLITWIISSFELEVLNYLEHYGLIRETGSPIDYRHSWDVHSSPWTQWGFIEIGLQADHHDRGETHFWELNKCDAPDTGLGYYAMLSMIIVPPVWESFIKPHLAKWDEERASEGEKIIAGKMNYKAGWTDMPLCEGSEK